MKVLRNKKTLVDYIERHKEMGKKLASLLLWVHYILGTFLYTKLQKENDEIISSIFVNPTQFNNPDDFEKYPQTLENDLKLLEKAGVDAVYVPKAIDIYPEGLKSKHYDFDGLDNEMEGKYRPGHFDGVGTVVEELLRQVQPHNAYFGEKDYQQLAIIKKMVEKTKLPVKIHGVPTLRENSGLAMSSRNLRLTEKQRKEATIIYETLLKVKEWFKVLSVKEIKERVEKIFQDSNFELEYFIIADEKTLKETDFFTKTKVTELLL
jgi:pantoate--beta-alanine ligase